MSTAHLDHLHAVASLPAAFRGVARRRGQAVAVTDGSTRTTYRRLDEESDLLAGRLLAEGVRRGELVGLLLDWSATSVIGMLGILKAGAAYVPLDPSYPLERLQFTVADAGVRRVVGAAGRLAEVGLGHLTGVDPAGGAVAGRPAPSRVPEVRVCGDDPAYVIYTSGSTGEPKGCVVSHANAMSLLRAALPLFAVDHDDRWTLFHSFSFDFSVWELWGALATGGRVVCVPQHAALSPPAFVDLLATRRITVLNQVPSVFRRVVDAYREGGRPELSLRYLVFGGERVDLPVIGGFLSCLRGPRPLVVNMYGITETTVHVTFKLLTDRDLAGPVRSPIGRPLPHLRVDVWDEQRRPVPPGSVGELWVSGAGVATGYLNRPELTRQRFVTLVAADGARRYYRTGDLGLVLPDGELAYVGRLDQQVKLRGFRIEPGEIEAVLRDSGLVSAAVVTVVTPATGRPFLLASVVPNPGCADGISTRLRVHLASRLPRYLLPDRYQVLTALPVTASGKTDVRALAEAAGTDAGPDGSETRPSTSADAGCVTQLLLRLKARDIRVWADGGRLRYDAPAGALTDELRAELRARKAEIVSFLAEAGRVAAHRPGRW